MNLITTSNSSRWLMLRAMLLPFILLALFVSSAAAIHTSIPAVHGDVSRNLLGDGTGVVVGIIDSGIDDTHPALTGMDSLGNPRMVTEANFVTSEGGNTGDDVFGHGTWVSSVVLSSDATHTGFAPDARFINARALSSSIGFSGSWVPNATGFAIDQGADILNLSLNYNSNQSNGNNSLDRMLDWAAYERDILVVTSAANISTQSPNPFVRAPASIFNGLSVGATNDAITAIPLFSANGQTSDGRSKPDVVAPGTTIRMANDDWENTPGTADDWEDEHIPGIFLNGTSFAAPHVTGLLAQFKDYGNTNGLSTSPLVARTSIINSTVVINDKEDNAWEPGSASVNMGVFEVTKPLDTDSGAGLIDGLRLYNQYAAGEQSPGNVDEIGWDLNTINGIASINYNIEQELISGTTLTASLAWFRHMSRSDNGNNKVDAGDSFSPIGNLDNLDMEILLDGVPIAASISDVDNLEFLRITVPETGLYSIRVNRLAVVNSGNDELYSLSWYGSTSVPEPSTIWLFVIGLSLVGVKYIRRAN